MGSVLAALKSGAAIVTGGVALASAIVMTWKQVMLERAATKAQETKDTSDLDKSLGE